MKQITFLLLSSLLVTQGMAQNATPTGFTYKKTVKDLVISTPTPPQAGNPVLDVSTNNLSFNAVQVGLSNSLTVLAANSGTATLQGLSFAAVGQSFTVSTNCATSLNPGASCLITVQYAPTALTQSSGTLTVSSSNGNKTVALSGNGSGAYGNLQPSSTTDFGSVAVNSSLSQSFTYTNEGNLPSLNTYAAVNGPGLSLGANNCGTSATPVTLQAGTTCQYSVTYSPTAVGSLTGSTQVTSSAINSPSALSLTGQAVTPESAIAALSTTELIVTTRQNESSSASVALLNDGNATLYLNEPPALSQEPGAGFSSTTNCGTSLSPAQSCVVDVTYASSTLDEKQGTLQFSTSDGLKSVLLRGITQAALTARASSALQSQQDLTGEFGSVEVGSKGTKNVYLLPSGTYSSLQSSAQIVGPDASSFAIESVSKYLVSYSNEYWASAASCGSVVSSNSSTLCQGDPINSQSSSARRNHQYVISFTPQSEGLKSATLILTNNGYGTSPISINLSGSGTATPVPELSTPAVEFGLIDINTASQGVNVSLMNTGNGTMYLSNAPEIKGADSTSYSATTNCGSVLAPNAHCETSVVFSPTSSGSKSAYLEFTSSNTVIPNVTLNGTTGVSSATLEPDTGSSTDFGQTPVTSSKVNVYTYKNTGTKVLSNVVGSITVSPYFNINSALTTCGTSGYPTSLNVGASCNIAVTFAPMPISNYSANLSVTSSASNSVPDLALTGVGSSVNEFYNTFDSGSYTAETGGVGVYSAGGNVASFYSGSLSFTAASTTSSGYVQYPSSASFAPGTGDFEVEFRFNRQADNGTFSGGLFSLYANPFSFMDIYLTGNAALAVQLNSGSANYISTAPGSIGLNTWYTIKVVRKNGNMYMTMSGSPINIATCSSAGVCGTYTNSQPLATSLSATYAVRLGNRGFSNTRPFRGYIDYVRYSKVVP